MSTEKEVATHPVPLEPVPFVRGPIHETESPASDTKVAISFA